MSDRTALVTGATGFIASHLLPSLLDEGWQVRACGRRPRPDTLAADVVYRSVDLAGGDGLGELLDGVTHVFHLAGASSTNSTQEEMDRSNVEATSRLVEAALKSDVERLLYMSSTSVYGEEVQLQLPVQEDAEKHPSRGYGKAKWGAEQAVWRGVEQGLPGLVLRPVSTYGPGNIKLLGSAVLDVAIEHFAGQHRLPIPAQPIEQRLVHVDDVVGACTHLIDHRDTVGRAFNVTLDTYPTSHEVAAVLAGEFGMDVELSDDPDCGPDYEERAAVRKRMLDEGMGDHIVFTKERFRFMRKANRNNRLSIDALLGTGFRFREADLPASIARTVAWYRQHRWVI